MLRECFHAAFGGVRFNVETHDRDHISFTASVITGEDT